MEPPDTGDKDSASLSHGSSPESDEEVDSAAMLEDVRARRRELQASDGKVEQEYISGLDRVSSVVKESQIKIQQAEERERAAERDSERLRIELEWQRRQYLQRIESLNYQLSGKDDEIAMLRREKGELEADLAQAAGKLAHARDMRNEARARRRDLELALNDERRGTGRWCLVRVRLLERGTAFLRQIRDQLGKMEESLITLTGRVENLNTRVHPQLATDFRIGTAEMRGRRAVRDLVNSYGGRFTGGVVEGVAELKRIITVRLDQARNQAVGVFDDLEIARRLLRSVSRLDPHLIERLDERERAAFLRLTDKR